MTKTKKLKPKGPDPTVEMGALPFPEFMALLNAATLGCATTLGENIDRVVELQYYAAKALALIGPDRWNAMMLEFQRRSAPAAKASKAVVGEDFVLARRSKGVQ